jgi:arabinogalactan endo-1,4-beta-galactosidase
LPKGIGFAYWGADFIAFKGNEAKNGSSWENQALWNFNNQALPALSVFNN